ncbi:hypothetical protein TNIN_60331 [Trichonephila inaurata madagascariensis]|uniref:Uncharacterized protein n=1 Tax=Trichonephila inaurata madagascariensis TaxID=2747483 RepID=A0A8X6YAA2_9ARAC|nr:hypothetical protein TNIN_60331 [Trichonephila inaurata madagascariensis]
MLAQLLSVRDTMNLPSQMPLNPRGARPQILFRKRSEDPRLGPKPFGFYPGQNLIGFILSSWNHGFSKGLKIDCKETERKSLEFFTIMTPNYNVAKKDPRDDFPN